MSPCAPSDLTINVPSGPIGPAIPGFGTPFAPKLPNFNIPLPNGFPESLLDILDLLKFVLPSGTIKPALNPNFGKDVFDGIMSLLEQFIPFLMLYKFFLPILELIICIIEVLCAIPNPFKLASAIRRLFRVCLPNFLALFPIFALIVMLLSLLALILALIEYIINEILKLINLLLRNIQMISKALSKVDEPSILAAVNKIGMILCAFQNLFVILGIFKIIVDAIKDIFKLLFAIPPCDDGDNNNIEKCCSPDVCPSFIKNCDGMERSTGSFRYLRKAVQGLSSMPSGFPESFPLDFFENVLRKESWQFYDEKAALLQQFWNISRAYDLPTGIYTIFFPLDSVYDEFTAPSQVPYKVNFRMYYEPSKWGRIDPLGSRFIRIDDCIVLRTPTQLLTGYTGNYDRLETGVLELSGGRVYEDNGTRIVIDGSDATLNNFIHKDKQVFTSIPTLSPSDEVNFTNITYTFHINYEVLLSKSLITLGCIPIVALDRQFINSVFAGNAGANYGMINDLLNNQNGNTFPDIDGAINCLNVALSTLRDNISVEGVATFQAMTTICLNQLADDTRSAISSLVGIGFDPYNSKLVIDPSTQFTTQSINVQVALNETSGQSITSGLPSNIAEDIAQRIVPTITFGQISKFVYDGQSLFNAKITSNIEGSGTIQVAFDNSVISTATVPSNLSQSPVIAPVVLPYTFVYSPSSIGNDGAPRRDEGDVAGNSSSNSQGG